MTAPPLRIVFFGTPEFAVPSLDAVIQSRHELVALVSQPDRPKGRGQQVQVTPTKAAAASHGIPVLQPSKIRDEAFLQQIRDVGPDLGIVVAFGRLLPDALLAIPRLGMINVHASILPRYRGAAPIQRAVLAGDGETGVTIMRVITEMDAGPTFAIATVPIPADATSADMAVTLAHLGPRLLLPVVEDLAAGRAVETPQDDALATHAAKISKAESAIDWSEPAAMVHNKVRGLQPWPLASTRLAGERLVLRRTSPVPVPADPDLTPGPGTPGRILRAQGDELIVACGAGTALRVLDIQPEGRRAMTAREFMAGRGVTEGARFEP
ncbi:MAG TPA: methionyl-tRNA formyltransferase [Vicinamibacterales bacterium]|nr:methionyl-tRNA formyltransferase [Vicinamibacterales bacterium]